MGGKYRRCEDDLAMRRFDVRMHVRSGDEERRATSRPRARKKKQIKPKGSEKKRERRRSGS